MILNSTPYEIGRTPFRRYTDFSVCSVEERTLIYSYLLNMIKAGFASRFPEPVFNYCVEVIGQRLSYDLLKLQFPKLGPDDMDDMYYWAERNISSRDICAIIHGIFAPKIIILLKRRGGRHNREWIKRMKIAQELFKLSEAEMSLLQLFYILNTNSAAANALGEDPVDLTNYHLFKLYGHSLLGMNQRLFRSLLNRTVLIEAGIIDFDGKTLKSLERHVLDYLLGIGGPKLKDVFFTRINSKVLELSDFSLRTDDLSALKMLLANKNGCNILFYGEPGTGKTSLAHSLAQYLRRDLYSVRIAGNASDHDEETDQKFRIKALYATLNTADRDSSVILVDEADELLNAAVMPQVQNATNKSWINNFLDTHNRKIVWITNRAWGIEPSTMRRFSFSLEFDPLTTKSRLSVLQNTLKSTGLTKYAADRDLQELCKKYKVDAGGIVNAVNVLKMKKSSQEATPLQMAEAVLRNHERATLGKKHHGPKKSLVSYSLEGLNTTPSLAQIAETFADLEKQQDRQACASLLLYGPPGTGKSEFVHYLGNLTARDVSLKRVSDIDSMYVGETEKNIARAFREAKEEGSILFFDEADSFFYPRKDATRSWEKKFTNEVLAQLDAYSGIVVFATNDIEGLDHAAIRRFKFKVKFSFLEPDGVLHFYATMLASLTDGTPLSDLEMKQLRSINRLSPGDFVVVRDQHTFVPQARPTHQALVSGLEHEVRHKKLDKLVGF